jgi:GGDEF domain-containing protein
MNQSNSLNINIILNHWSLTIQIAILSVFVIVFFALKLSSKRKVIASWFYAWLFNAFALSMVIVVLWGTETMSPDWLRLFYSLYAIAKISFALFLFIGLYQIIHDKNLFSARQQKLIISLILGYLICIHLFQLQLLSIQISVYLIVGSLFLISFLSQLHYKSSKSLKIIIISFLFEALMFLHHGLVLIPVFEGEPLPNYMTHISFFDAILELIVGISCLFTVAIKIIDESNHSYIQMLKSQKALRQLVDVDPLTGLWHRRYLETFLKQYSSGANVATIQINNLNLIKNDWGPAAAELCLKEVAKLMKSHFGSKDGLFRLNEDSLLVISPNDGTINLNTKIQGLKNKVAANPLCAPIIFLNSEVCHYQQKSELENSLPLM